MDEFYEWSRRHPWFSPLAYSAAIHLAFIILLMFIIIPSVTNPNEHVTEHFRVKGVKDLPVLAGKPGGGGTKHFINPSKFAPQGQYNPTNTLHDVSLQSLVDPDASSLKQIAVEVEPKKTELQDRLFSDGRDFQTLMSTSQENRLKEKIKLKQQSTEDRPKDRALSSGSAPGQEALLRFLQKPLQGLNLSAIQSVQIDPEEGMPGFTPAGSGGGGGGLSGSGSTGGFPDGLVGEPKESVSRYGSLDDLLDIQVFTYQDPSAQPASDGKYFMIKIFAKKNAAALKVMSKEILFTIDCSLSISPERLDEFKRGIGYCLKHLNPDDIFNIIAFKDKTQFFSPKSVKATPATIQKAERFVSELSSNRTTDVYGAFEKIVKTPPNRHPSNIILISDGRPTHGVVDSRELINSVTRLNQKVRPVFAYSGGAKVNRYLLDFISYQNRGWSQFIKERGQIRKGLADFYDKIKDPIFLNLRYRLNGVNAGDVYPKSLPDFYRNAEFTLFGKYNDEKEFSTQLLGDVDGNTKELIFTRSLAQAPKGGPDILKGYVFNKIYHLISEMTEKGQTTGRLEEIRELSSRYQVTTPYTIDLEKVD